MGGGDGNVGTQRRPEGEGGGAGGECLRAQKVRGSVGARAGAHLGAPLSKVLE
jgi:hypothetical protein